MRRLMFAVLAAALIISMPARAEVAISLQAAQVLQESLGAGKTIGSGEGPDVIMALTAAAAKHPALLTEMAALIAVARPDLMESLRQAIKQISPDFSESIIKQIEQASIDPSVDQLAALANLEGIAPAADSASDSPVNSGTAGTDLGWADGAAVGGGSPN